METFAEGTRFVHVLFGAAGLAAFWIPVFARKGAATHRRFGRIFANCAYVVLGAAALALALRLADLHSRDVGVAEAPELYGFIVFLGYLTLVTFVIVRHGLAVLRHKNEPAALKTPTHVVLAWAAVAASLFVIAFAIAVWPRNAPVLLALSPIGITTGFGNLKYMKATTLSSRAWMYEHLGSMLGAGIAFHTAFAVFGSTRLFDIGLTGWIAVVPWILPAAIGIPAIAIWTRAYRRRFGELA